jgi:magnesium-protoporphyrin O-methyltransferase
VTDCCRNDLDAKFGRRQARKQLKGYRAKGAAKETRLLIEGLLDAGVTGASLLDVGGGIGSLSDALLGAGAAHAVHVDASHGYVEAAEELAREHGNQDRLELRAADFVDVAASLTPADIVTLDKVVCCYPDAERLITLSADRATRLYGLVYPDDSRLVRAATVVQNALRSLGRTDFRTYIHPVELIERLVRERGFRLRWSAAARVWRVRLYERLPAVVLPAPGP